MRILRVTLAMGLSLVAFSSLRAETSFGRQWMDHYYQNPRPNDFVRGVDSLNREGYFDAVVQPDIAIGFFSAVFKQNPQQVERWLRASAPLLSERPRRILAAAAWLAGSPAGAQRMLDMSARDDSDERAAVVQMAMNGPSAPVADIAVSSEPALNLQWGAFLATGNERYITNVLAALGSNQPGLATSACFTLAQNAAADPHVLQICRTQLDRQPESIRAEFQSALNDATGRKPSA